MAGNITLPRASSQANIQGPILDRPEPTTALQDVVSAIPGLAKAFIRANEVQDQADARDAQLARQQQLDSQKLEDASTLGLAASNVNALLANREAAASAENTLQSLSIDLNQALADGNISEADKKLQETFISTFQKVQDARSQGLLDDNRFSLKAREAKQKFMAQHPHLGVEIDKIFNTATGRQASAVTGAAAQRQLAFNQQMESKYGLNYTPDDVLVETAKQQAVQDIQRNKQLGQISLGQVISDTNGTLNLAIDSLTTEAATLYSEKQALNQDELDSLNGRIEELKRTYVRGIDEEIAGLRASGQIVAPADVRAQKEFALSQLEDAQAFINSKDLQKMLAKRKQVQNDLWMNGLGGQINKLNQIAGTMGSGGLTVLSGFIGASTPEQEAVIKSAAAESGISNVDLSNTKQLVLDAATRVASPTPTPGFEKLDAVYGLGAMKAGKTSPVVETNTLRNLDSLVEEAQDVSGAISQINDPKISLTYKEAEPSVQNELIQNVNGWESVVFGAIEDGGYAVEFNNETQSLVVFREENVLAAERFGQGQSTQDVGLTRKRINQGLSSTMNDILSVHSNPNYTGILQDPLQWLRDITNQFQVQPIQQEETQPTADAE